MNRIGRKGLAILCGSALMIGMLGGCGANTEGGGDNASVVEAGTDEATTDAGEETAAQEAGEEATAEQDEQADDAGNAEQSVDAQDTEASDQSADTAQADESGSADDLFAKAFDEEEVQNNGGHFVKVGDRVYYLVYEEGAIDKISLFGGFLDQMPLAGGKAQLYYYDLTKEEAVDTGVNAAAGSALFAGRDGFYMTIPKDTETYMASKLDPETGDMTDIAEGQIRGVSNDGKYVTVEVTDKTTYTTSYAIYENGEKIGEIAPNGDNFLQYCGWTDHAMVCMEMDYESGHNMLYALPAGRDQETIKLGQVPDPEMAMANEAEVEQFISDGDNAYMNLAYYEGTGHFLAEQEVVSMKADQADSVQKMEDVLGQNDGEADPGNEEAEEGPSSDPQEKIFLQSPGSLGAARALAGDLELSESYYGDLLWHDSPYSAFTIVKDFVSKPDEDLKSRAFDQEMVSFGTTAFVILATAEHKEEEDIGWRMAYEMKSLQYLCIPFGGEVLAGTGEGEVKVLAKTNG